MLEVTSFGLTGLAALVIIAFGFACGDELPPALKKFFEVYHDWLGCFPAGATHSHSVARRSLLCSGRRTEVGKMVLKSVVRRVSVGALYAVSLAMTLSERAFTKS